MSSEADIVRSMLRTLNAIDGVYCLRTHGGSFQMRGTPDIIGCAKGFFFAIEAKKSSKEKPTEAQLYVLDLFKEARGKVFVSCDPRAAEVTEWIAGLPD